MNKQISAGNGKGRMVKSTFLCLAIVLACSCSAKASGDEYYEGGYEGGERYEHGGRYGGEYYERDGRYGRYYGDGDDYYRGNRYERREGKIYGPVEAMPPAGFSGMWRIAGRDVMVNPNTYIKQEYGPIGMGAQVEVKGWGNPFVAYEIEVKSSGVPVPAAPSSVAPAGPPAGMATPGMAVTKIYGPVESMPPDGFNGIWRIAGRDVTVNQLTRVKQEYGWVGVGAQVEVKGSGGEPVIAYEIEVKSGVRR